MHQNTRPCKTTLSTILLLITYALPTISFAAQGDVVTSEKRANTFLNENQANAKVAITSSGNFQIVWTSGDAASDMTSQDGNDGGIFSQRFSANGALLGNELQVNTTTIGDEFFPRITMDSGGKSVIAWHNSGVSFNNRFFQRYNKDGTRNDIEKNIDDGGATFPTLAFPGAALDIATDVDGDMVLVTLDAMFDISAHLFGDDGLPMGGAINVSESISVTTAMPYSYSFDVAMCADGGFVIVWEETDMSAVKSVMARLYNANGVSIGTAMPFRVDGVNVLNNASLPKVSMDVAGNFVVVWAAPDGNSDGIFMRRYDANGNALISETQVNTFNTSQAIDGSVQSSPAVAMDALGNFVITWHSFGQDGQSLAVIAKRYDTNGNALGDEFIVNDFIAGVQGAPDVAMDADGDFVITWESIGQGDDYDIYFKVYSGSSDVDLSIVVDTNGNAFVDTGGAIAYNLTVTNNYSGDSTVGDIDQDAYLQHVGTASGITVKHELDPLIEFVDTTSLDWSCEILPDDAFDNTVTCTYSNALAPSDSTIVTINAKAPDTAARLNSVAIVTAVQTDSAFDNNVDSAGINVTGAGGAGLGQGLLAYIGLLIGGLLWFGRRFRFSGLG